MPEIPIAQSAQVLNPSSPVSIGDSSSARVMADEQAKFGNAIFTLGDILDTAGRQAKDRASKADQALKAAEFTRKALTVREQFAGQATNPEDKDGTVATDAYNKKMDEIRSEYAGTFDSPVAEKEFMAHALSTTNENSLHVYSTEITKLDKRSEDNLRKAVSQDAQSARMDPSNILKYLDSTTTHVMAIPGQSAAQAEINVRKAHAEVINEVFRGHLDNGYNDPNFESSRMSFGKARQVLEQFGNDYLSNDQKDKMLEKVDQAFVTKVDRDWKTSTQMDQLHDLQRKKYSQLKNDYYASALLVAGPNEMAARAVFADMALDVRSNQGFTGSDMERFINQGKVFSKPGDDKYELMILGQLSGNKRNVSEVIDRVKKDQGNSVSNDRAIDILNKLTQYEERQRRDPEYVAQIAAGQKRIEAQGEKDILLAAADPLMQDKIKAKVAESVGRYHKILAGNSAADPMEVALGVVSNQYGAKAGLRALPGPYSPLDTEDSKGMQKIILERKTDKERKIKAGAWTPSENTKYNQFLKDALKRKNTLDADQGVIGGSTSTTQPGGTTPAKSGGFTGSGGR
jgi:hypothetical protein